MPDIFDTHCHLFMEPLRSNLNDVLARARRKGVKRFLVPSVSRKDWDDCVSMASLKGVQCALGIHPWEADEGLCRLELQEMLESSGAAAVGEIGLDWKCGTDREVQKTVFIEQLETAEKLSLPVILHCRGAFEEMLGILADFRIRGTVHAWSRDPELMKRFLELGLFVSFGGAVTRKGARRALASAIAVPEGRFLLETDSPSIGLDGVAPGDSQPAHAADVLQALAVLRGEFPDRIAAQAMANSVTLFGE